MPCEAEYLYNPLRTNLRFSYRDIIYIDKRINVRVRVTEMKRICIYCEKWSSGGIESFIVSMLQKMDIADFQIDLVSSCVENSPFTPFLKAKGIKIHQLSGNRNRVFSNRKMFMKLMETQQYDVLHINAFHGAELYYLFLGEKMEIPKRIGHAHNSMLKKSWLSTVKILIHNVGKTIYAKYGTDLWSCSEAATRFLFPRAVWNEVTILPNGIDVLKFRFSQEKRSKIRSELNIGTEIVLGNVGRFCRQKNQMFILKIFDLFLKKHPDSKLLLIGDGEDRNILTKQVSTLGIEKSVIFIGFTNHVENFLCAMDVFLFPSVFEGLGIVAIEAQASGLPLICSDQVPMEAMLLPNVQRLSLKSSVEQWVQSVEKGCKISNKRDNCADLVKNKGYDVETVSTFIQNMYGGT